MVSLGCILAMGCDRYDDYTPEKGFKKDPEIGIKGPCNDSSVSYQTIGQGSGPTSNIQKDENLVISDEQKWESTWRDLKGSNAQLPSIDFSKNVVIAAFQGEKSNGGYAIEIEEVCKDGKFISVEVVNKVPEQGCPVTQGFTNPYHLVKISKAKLGTSFKNQQVNFSEKKRKHCSSDKGSGKNCQGVSFSEIESGNNSEIQKEQRKVIRTQAEFSELWDEIRGDVAGISDLPKIDFQSEMVVGVFTGRKPSGGYSVQVTDVCKENDGLTVTVTSKSPGSQCMVNQAITSPYQLVAVPKASGAVSFENKEHQKACE